MPKSCRDRFLLVRKIMNGNINFNSHVFDRIEKDDISNLNFTSPDFFRSEEHKRNHKI